MSATAFLRCASGWLLLVSVGGCSTLRGGGCDASESATVLPALIWRTDSLLARPRPANAAAVTELHEQLGEIIRRVQRLEVCGGLTSAQDLRTAARLALRAGMAGAPLLREAYVWGREAVLRAPLERESWQVMATAWDELQISQNHPQWFGTVIRCAARGTRPCALATLDTSRVSDAQRVELGLRTLREQRLVADSLNRARRR